MFDMLLATVSGEVAVGAGWAVVGGGLAAGLAALAAGIGLGRIAHGRADAIARQPEAAGDISGGSLLLGFLVEGVALFACVIAILGVMGATVAFDPAGYKQDQEEDGAQTVAPAETDGEHVDVLRYDDEEDDS